MGSRNPDRIPIRDRWRQARTVAEMADKGWDVLSKCRTCELTMQVDLGLIAQVSGPATSLWNRTARCRRYLCPGIVDFHAKAPGMTWHEKLIFDVRELDPVPAWLRNRHKPASDAGS